MTLQASEDADKTRAMSRWKLILEDNLHASHTGRLIVKAYENGKNDNYVNGIIQDTVAKKATGTLLKRAGSIMRFVVWHRSSSKEPTWPVTEVMAYDYVKHLHEQRKGVTAASAFVEALKFCQYVFQIDGCSDVTSSSRIAGAAHAQFVSKQAQAT